MGSVKRESRREMRGMKRKTRGEMHSGKRESYREIRKEELTWASGENS